MTPNEGWDAAQIKKASEVDFTELLNAGFELQKLIENAKRIGDARYSDDVAELDIMLVKLTLEFEEDTPFPADKMERLGEAIGRLRDEATGLEDSFGIQILEGIENGIAGPRRRTMTKRTQDLPTDPEEARKQAIESYKELVNKMFSNLERDIIAGIKASKALAATGKICDQQGDRDDGEYMVQMLEALNVGVKKMESLYKERFGDSDVSDNEWKKLD